MREIVKIGAMLDSISTRKDRSIKIVFQSQEVSSTEGAHLMSLRDSFGWLLFAPTPEGLEVPDEPPAEFRNEKSCSQRLRAVIFVWWEQSGKPIDFETFYREKMERVISWIKEKLEPEL